MARSLRGIYAATFAVSVAASLALASSTVMAGPYSSMIVFGDSLSDSGNNAIVVDSGALAAFGIPAGARTLTPISSPAFIPSAPYASNRYSNGPVWVETVAGVLGVPLAPSLAGGTNWAFGGATTGPASASLTNPFPASLATQTNFYLGSTGGVASASALYVIAGGGNDARAVLTGSITPANAITAYVTNTITILSQLYSAGARTFLLVNTPDVGKTPALQLADLFSPGAAAGASGLVGLMNANLNGALGLLPADLRNRIRYLDADALIDNVFASPGAFGIADATSACAFACPAGASNTFFWDGIHPTAAGHLVIANAALRLVPEPGVIALFAVMLGALMFTRRRTMIKTK